MKATLIITLALLTIFSCTDKEAFVESKKYHEEELKAINDVFNEIADTTFYYKKLRERNAEQAVFFLNRNLDSIDNSGKKDEPLNEFVTVELKRRLHYIKRLGNFPRYRFAPAEEKKVNRPIQLNRQKGEEYMYMWITLSRVLFNSDYTEGLLYYKKWSGRLGSDGGTLTLKKIKGKWVVTKKIIDPFS